ncbi:hypothetical protein CHLRE_02g082050v5 [Chlamydomonas reinhardtii]|uniref:Coiled-coil domain-containing protein 130 n=1 Tax=Chlamydomonas reinhardtii TaxID=3055 RepID=A0A2K3E0M8_CHLRE|nr:uncharacterized protein CHLRE_02g082050v5 [Chlamydomonas reinhardtii]PNW86325.1 hypothetical protein CHLRE_02g082050v5 [Chlamydomonas reinhardtii]
MSSLAAARADNFYYAPDFDPKKHKSLNKYNGQHPLRERAAKLDQGILVIRFEVPFNIWCDKCGEHIAKGERFNAEKKAIGNYHSTKILQFSMTHHCGCTICIQTDPKNAEYIVVEGARKKVETYSAKAAGVMELPDEAEKERRDKDPLYRLEYQQGAKAKALTGAARVAAIHDMADDRAADPYALNKALRASLRADKRAAAAADAERRALGLHESVRLLPASEGDAIAAQTAFLTSSARAEAGAEAKRKRILEQDIFSSGRGGGGDGSSTAAGIAPTPGGAHKAGIRSISQAGASTAALGTSAAAMTRPQHAVPAGGSRREHDADGPPPAKRQAVSWAAVVATAAPSRLHASSSSEPGAAAPAVSATAAVAPAARSGGASLPSGRVGGGETGINMGSETAVVTGPSSVAARSLGGRQERAGRSAAAEALASSYAAVAARGVSESGPGTGAGTGAGPCAMSGSSRRSTGGGGASSAGGGAGGSGGVVGASRAVTANQGAVGGAAAAGSSRPPPGAGALAAAAQAAARRKLHGGRAASSHHTAAAAAAGARPHSAGALGAGAAAGASGGGLKRTLKDRAAELQQRRGGGGAGLMGFSAPCAPM